MKSNIKVFAPLLIAILLGSLTFILAQSGAGNSGNPQKRGVGLPPGSTDRRQALPPPIRMFERLNLSDQQRQQIESIEDSSRQESQAHFDKLKAIQDKLNEAANGTTFDENQVRAILNNRAQVMTEIEIIRFRNEAAIKNLLTGQQRAELERLKQQRSGFPSGQGMNIPPPRPDGAPNMPPPQQR